MNAAWAWLFWSELPAGERRAAAGRRLRAHPSRPAGPSRPVPAARPGGPSRRAAAAPVTAPQPPRCHIVAVLTVTM